MHGGQDQRAAAHRARPIPCRPRVRPARNRRRRTGPESSVARPLGHQPGAALESRRGSNSVSAASIAWDRRGRRTSLSSWPDTRRSADCSRTCRAAFWARRGRSRQIRFATSLPPESDVRATLLSSDPPHTTPSNLATHGPSDLRWPSPAVGRRAASVIARALSRRRRLARRWRAGSIETARTIRASLNRRPRCLPTPAPAHADRPVTIVICSVPVLNGQDELVERRVVALAVEVGVAMRWTELAKDAQASPRSVVAPRARNCRGVARAAAATLGEREAAIRQRRSRKRQTSRGSARSLRCA